MFRVWTGTPILTAPLGKSRCAAIYHGVAVMLQLHLPDNSTNSCICFNNTGREKENSDLHLIYLILYYWNKSVCGSTDYSAIYPN